MTREQALNLWWSTLALGESTGAQELEPVWADAGLTVPDRAALASAAAAEGDLARREALVRATRRLIAGHGFDVDLLSTPAARMRGL